jgi:hypothetical protein
MVSRGRRTTISASVSKKGYPVIAAAVLASRRDWVVLIGCFGKNHSETMLRKPPIHLTEKSANQIFTQALAPV